MNFKGPNSPYVFSLVFNPHFCKCGSVRKVCNSSKKVKLKIAPLPEVKRFIMDCFMKLGVKCEHAKIFAEGLIAADYRGISSHGVNRLERYITDVKGKACDPNADPKITAECDSSAVVCGRNGLGIVIGKFSMKLAIKKAKKTGIAMVVANSSNHFGINSFYTGYAVSKGFIGMAFTNTSPVMVPLGAKQPCFGTNPLSIAAPGEQGDSINIDFATTAVPLGKLELYRMRKKKIPLGWALDADGKPTDDPVVALKAKKLAPLGGKQGHKGTGLGMMVDILSGVISGSAFGPFVRVWGQKPIAPANLGHGFIAINPKNFEPGFEQRLSKLICFIRQMEPVDPKRPMIVPGDMERATMRKIDKQGGIAFQEGHLKMIDRITKDLGVKPIKFKTN